MYVALSAMEKWGIVDDETGLNLSTLYDLLREQFQDLDDPWCKETLQWWDEYVSKFPHLGSRLFTDHTIAKFSQILPMMTGGISGIWKVQQ